MMLLKNLYPSEKINRRIRVVSVLLSQIKRKSCSVPIAMEETTSKLLQAQEERAANQLNADQEKRASIYGSLHTRVTRNL